MRSWVKMIWLSFFAVQFGALDHSRLTPSASDQTVSPPAKFARNSFANLPREVYLLTGYLSQVVLDYSAAVHPDRRPAEQILANLVQLPVAKKRALREYILQHGNNLRHALVVMGDIFPEGHRAFLLESLEKEDLTSSAVWCLASTDDPRVLAPILSRVEPSRFAELKPLARLSNSRFLSETKKLHQAKPTVSTAYVLGCYGMSAEAEIRSSVRSGQRDIRSSALWGLSKSDDVPSLDLLVSIADLGSDDEWQFAANRFVKEGLKNVPRLNTWLNSTPDRKRIAAYALARIRPGK